MFFVDFSNEDGSINGDHLNFLRKETKLGKGRAKSIMDWLDWLYKNGNKDKQFGSKE